MTDLATVAANLRAIEDMALRLESRAIDRAGARDIPGGEAMVNLASVGSLADWQRRVELSEQQYGNGGVDLSSEDPDDLWPAVQVLWFWSEDYRDRLNHDHDDPRWRPTLVSEAKFLRNHDVAEWIWNNEIHWDDYARDVGRAKTKLESILLEGERTERTTVVCSLCDDGRRLIRVWGGELVDDRWKCPGCKHQFTDEELPEVQATQMRRSEPREWIPRPEAIDLLRSQGHQERVAARLADPLETQGWCHSVTHVRYVSWPDVWRRHLSEMQARRIKAERTTRSTGLSA